MMDQEGPLTFFRAKLFFAIVFQNEIYFHKWSFSWAENAIFQLPVRCMSYLIIGIETWESRIWMSNTYAEAFGEIDNFFSWLDKY